MKLLASSRAEARRLETGFRYVLYVLALLVAVFAALERKYFAAAVNFAWLAFIVAACEGFLPERWFRRSSPAGNKLAVVLAVTLVAAIVVVWWSRTHGV
jgi:hypothetical protein